MSRDVTEDGSGRLRKDGSSGDDRKGQLLMWAIVIAAAILTVAAGALLRGKSYIVVSILLVIYCMVPFFVSFERRRPQARELVTLAVMCALAVASRAAFAWVPYFKPMAAVVMISGMAFGAPAGFMTGALSMLASNFIFGQGPWTPWQMIAFGLCGGIFGHLAERGILPRCGLSLPARTALSVAGGAFFLCVAGPLLDTSSLLFMVSRISWESVIAVYAAGFSVNCIQAAATAITLFALANPLLDKLARLRRRYGMLA